MTYSGTFRTTIAPGQWNVRWAWPIDPTIQSNSWPLCGTGSTDDVSNLIRGGTWNTPTAPGPAQPRPVTTVSPTGGDDAPMIQRWLNGGDDVCLLAGVFQIGSTITMPQFSRVFSSGATVKCLPGGSAAQTLFQPGNHCTIEGINLWPASRAVLNTQAQNFTMKSCTVNGGMLGQVGPGALFQYNDFPKCSVQIYANHLHWSCCYRGISLAGPSCFSTGMSNSAVVDCVWDRTDRGPVNQVGHSAITNCAWIRPVVRDICQTNGGSEWFLVEGSPDDGGMFQNNLIWGMRVRGCVASMMFSGCNAKNNLIHDLDADQAGTILFNAAATAGLACEQSGNVIEYAELHGGTVGFLGNAVNNVFQYGALINPAVGRQGVFGWTTAQAAGRYGPLVAFTGGPTNKAQHVRVVGMRASDGLNYPGGVDCSVDCFGV